MMTRRNALAGFFSLAAASCALGRVPRAFAEAGDHVEHTDEEWRKFLIAAAI